MVGIWEEYGRALMPPINICLLMCPLAKQLVLPSEMHYVINDSQDHNILEKLV